MLLTRMAGISRPVTCALYAAELSVLPWRSGSTLSVRRRSKGNRAAQQPADGRLKGRTPGSFRPFPLDGHPPPTYLPSRGFSR